MTLTDIITSLDLYPEEAAIFAERINGRFLPESRAVVIELSNEELKRPVREIAAEKAPGTEYFLEIFIVRELLEGLQATGQAGITPTEAVDRIIYYAENDA